MTHQFTRRPRPASRVRRRLESANLAPLIDEVIGTAGQLAEKNKNRLIVEVSRSGLIPGPWQCLRPAVAPWRNLRTFGL